MLGNARLARILDHRPSRYRTYLCPDIMPFDATTRRSRLP